MPDARYKKPGDITPDMPDADRLMMENPQCWPVPGELGIGTLDRKPDGSIAVDVHMRTEGEPTMQGKLLSLKRAGHPPTDLGVLLDPGFGEAPYTIVQTAVMDSRLHELVNGERVFETLLDERDTFNPERELSIWFYQTAEEAVAAGWRVD